MPVSILFIILGIFIGCIANDKSASGVSSVVVQLVAFTSGMYFSSDMIGKAFDTVCKALPFSNALNIIKGVLNKDYADLGLSVIIVIAYTFVMVIITSIIFSKKLKSDNK